MSATPSIPGIRSSSSSVKCAVSRQMTSVKRSNAVADGALRHPDIGRDAAIDVVERYRFFTVAAVAAANDVPYGLAASVWTSDAARTLRVAHRLETGVVWVNEHLPIASEAPHGGI